MSLETKSHHILKNDRGFSLIEVLIAVALLTLGILAITASTGVVMEKNENSRKSSIAMTLAQDKVESIKGIARSWLLTGASGLDSPGLVAGAWTADPGGENIDSEGNPAASGVIYNRSWTIDPVAGTFFLYDVSVVLTWQDEGTKTLQLNTQITQ